jgi:hypothetical protein
MKFKKLVAAQRARQALDEMLPFVDCVARCHSTLVAKDYWLPAVSLQRIDENLFELTPIPLDSPQHGGGSRY